MISDRHANARAALQQPALSTPPAVGATVCDPNFGTSITRLTPAGYAVQLKEAFSINSNWFMAIGPSGALTVFGFDPTTGKPRMSGGKQVMITIDGYMIPQGPNGSLCPIHNVLWSKKEDNSLYIVACGARVFKYNLAAYSATNPLAGLVAGSNQRSVASWPSCSGATCRKGPVFMDFSDLFNYFTTDGQTGNMNIVASSNDDTFAGFVWVGAGYKYTQGVFVYRPWNNSLWYGTGQRVKPFQPYLYSGVWNGAAVNKRIIGLNLDGTGRYVALNVCADAAMDLNSCGTGDGYILDLNTVAQTSALGSARAFGVDTLTHGQWLNGFTTGHAGIVQALDVEYFQSSVESKRLRFPDLQLPSGWWGAYVTAPTKALGASGFPIAGALATFSYDTNYGYASPLTSCPNKKCIYADELLLFNLSGTRYLRVANTRSVVQDYSASNYWDLPRPSFNADGTYLAFSSNWGTPSAGTNLNYSVYAVRLPAAWKQVMDDSATMSPSVASGSPNEYIDLEFTHLSSKTGVTVLVQDGSMSAAFQTNACMFRLGKNQSIQLAKDNGSWSGAATGTLGLAGSVVENSQCRIDAASAKVVTNTQGNIVYNISVLFKKGFANKTLRSIMMLDGSSTWTDAGKISIGALNSILWRTLPSMPAVSGNTSRVWNSSNAYYAWGESSLMLMPGNYFEFTVSSLDRYYVSVSSTEPVNLYQMRLQSTIEVYQNWMNQGEAVISQNYGTAVTTTPLTTGSVVRVTYTTGKLTYTVNGKQVAVTTVASDNAPLYLLTCLMTPTSTFNSPRVGP